MAQVHIGCSGFNYKHWRGSFYPATVRRTATNLTLTFFSASSKATFTLCPTEPTPLPCA